MSADQDFKPGPPYCGEKRKE